MSEKLSEQDRLRVLDELRASVPEGVDIDSLLGGELAGPASEDRPDVPVWEYLDYLDEHPELSLDQVAEIRFPIVAHGGTYTVTSLAELCADPVPAPRRVTPAEMVNLFRLMHEAGGLRWEAADRTHYETQSPASYMSAVGAAWREGLTSGA